MCQRRILTSSKKCNLFHNLPVTTTSFQAFLLWPLEQNQLVFIHFMPSAHWSVKPWRWRQRSGTWAWQLRYGTVFDHRKDRHSLSLLFLIRYPISFQSVGQNSFKVKNKIKSRFVERSRNRQWLTTVSRRLHTPHGHKSEQKLAHTNLRLACRWGWIGPTFKTLGLGFWLKVRFQSW